MTSIGIVNTFSWEGDIYQTCCISGIMFLHRLPVSSAPSVVLQRAKSAQNTILFDFGITCLLLVLYLLADACVHGRIPLVPIKDFLAGLFSVSSCYCISCFNLTRSSSAPGLIHLSP